MALGLCLAFWNMINYQIIDHQHIEFENALSYTTKVEANKLPALLGYIVQNTDALGLEITGNLVFTITGFHEFTDKCILDIEILIPVNKAFLSSERYIYKPRFRLVNAVSCRIDSSIRELIDIRIRLSEYLIDNNLKAISNIYYIVSFSDRGTEIEYYEAVVSVNENIM